MFLSFSYFGVLLCALPMLTRRKTIAKSNYIQLSNCKTT